MNFQKTNKKKKKKLLFQNFQNAPQKIENKFFFGLLKVSIWLKFMVKKKSKRLF